LDEVSYQCFRSRANERPNSSQCLIVISNSTAVIENSLDMIRGFTRSFHPLTRTRYKFAQQFKSLSSQARVPDGASEEEHAAARTWLSKFSIHTIPRKLCGITFSRSSGPGGQNVNK